MTPHGFKDATADLQQVKEWWRRWLHANIALATGTPSGLMVLDIDPRNGGETSWRELRADRNIPRTPKQHTGGGGRHIFFRDPGGIKCGPLVTGVDVKCEGGYVIVPPSLHPSGETYYWIDEELGAQALLESAQVPDWLLSELRSARRQRQTPAPSGSQDCWGEGERNTRLTSLAGTMRARGMSRESIESALLVQNHQCCHPPLSDGEVRSIAESVSRYEPGDLELKRHGTKLQAGFRSDLPRPLNQEAFHGVAGELISLIEPHSEADPAALLSQLLVAVGNLIGRNVHFVAEADRHYTNLFAVLVGRTAKGRKGTSLGQIRRVLAGIDPKWTKRATSGLSTGEGLIAAVQDEGEVVTDKRLLVVESEFARVLQVCERQSSTLSPVIRQAWDSGSLRVMTKIKPACVTGAHISIVAHITKDELKRLLTATAVANGFANRFLWFWVQRSKVLPDGGKINKVDFEPITKKLHDAAEFAKKTGEIRRSKRARALWHEVYAELSEGMPGLLGSVTSRAEAQVMRVACVYAVLDCSRAIRLPHLRAALEVWRYSEESARFIFGDAVGDSTADKILGALRQRADGLTRDEIRELFHRDKSSEEIERALGVLLEHGRAHMEKLKGGTRGRPPERWLATSGIPRKTP